MDGRDASDAATDVRAVAAADGPDGCASEGPGTAGMRRLLVRVMVVVSGLALVATSCPKEEGTIDAGEDLEVLLEAGVQAVEFEVAVALTAASLEKPFSPPPELRVRLAGSFVPRGRPGSAAAEETAATGGAVPEVTGSVVPLDARGVAVGATRAMQDGSVRLEHPVTCPPGLDCAQRFRVRVTRSAGSQLPVLVRTELDASATYREQEDAPEGAELSLKLADPLPAGVRREAEGHADRERVAGFRIVEAAGERDPPELLTFVRTGSGPVEPVGVRVIRTDSSRGVERVVLEAFGQGPDFELPVGFATEIDPFVGCPRQGRCAREYLGTLDVTPGAGGSGRGELELVVPEGVSVVAGTERLPPLGTPRTVQTSGEVTLTEEDPRIEVARLFEAGTGEIEQDAPATLAARLEVTVEGEGSVEATLGQISAVHRTASEKAPTVSMATYADGGVRDGTLWERFGLGFRLEDAGPVTVAWTLTVAVDESLTGVPADAELRLSVPEPRR